MEKIKIANAPCSWGALEFDLEGDSKGYNEVLDEMKTSGYVGSELGDLGFMPSEPDELKSVIKNFDFWIPGAFVPVALADEEEHAAGLAKALKVAKLLVEAGFNDAFIVLADENGSVPERTLNAGRISEHMGLSEEEWLVFAKGADLIAQKVKDTYGLRTVFHHHCAGYIETSSEIDRLMKLTNPDVLGLCLDMGHCMYGGGNPVDILNKHYDRIWHVHFKDYNPSIGEQSKLQNWDYFDAVKAGVFCKLGEGAVDFEEIVGILKTKDYSGWIVVEQDVLPGMGSPLACAIHNREYIKKLGL
ncbi:sugar phosphate isomerase/epimerase [Belliella sp. DSM 111904]|uniref:Sugar phosphate isomerase/epimerase n=1 Tax=Belliella filtrata TaxID=2923435 RepID=A0ABS9UZF0_9BACT|nr:sugar phosphate isomerase/epimerase [Belliella filtrata]MCH7409453.1 sugar phosphate isomerase/epimerase [Belliella filtrata]